MKAADQGSSTRPGAGPEPIEKRTDHQHLGREDGKIGHYSVARAQAVQDPNVAVRSHAGADADGSQLARTDLHQQLVRGADLG